MNKVFLIGNLTRDPELRTTQTGVSVCSFTIAVNRRRPTNAEAGQPEADFFRVTAWRQLGENCSVQYNTLMIGYGNPGENQGMIKVGNNVRIAPNVMIISANHVFDNTDIPICKQGMDVKPITIEDDVWVAGRVNIMAGVTIGKGSVIGAGSVVTKDIPPYSVAVGVPAKVIKTR